MSTKTVKCANCNVVINELLAFLLNVLDYMDEESIHQLVSTSFNVESISNAKSLLIDSIPDAKKKMPQRRKDGKKRMSRDLDDMICLLKSTDPEIFPVFVAKDLHVLPSVSFDHIDCTRLLKDISRLQTQVKTLQETCVTMDCFEILKQEMEHMKHASIVDNRSTHNLFVNKKRGACLQDDSYELSSGPVGLQYVPIKSSVEAAAIQNMQVNSHSTPNKSLTATCSNNRSTCIYPQLVQPSDRQLVEQYVMSQGASESSGKPGCGDLNGSRTARGITTSYASVTSEPVLNAAVDTSARVDQPILISDSMNRSAGGVVSVDLRQSRKQSCSVLIKNCTQIPEENSEWQLVQSKSVNKYKLLGQKGRASTAPDVKFKSANIKVPMFISNVSKESGEQDIIGYIRDRTNEVVSLKRIKMKTDWKYNAYKLFVPRDKLDLFLTDEFWPVGITFRRFVHFMYSTKKEGIVKDS